MNNETVYEVGLSDLFDDMDTDNSVRVDSANDALIECVNKFGKVDIVYMSEISGIDTEQLVLELRGSAILQDPSLFTSDKKWDIEKGWVLKARYLCGNIADKLLLAKFMNCRFEGCFIHNITALEQVLPPTPKLEEIHFLLGSSWIPAEMYAAFVKDLLDLSKLPVVQYIKEVSEWRIVAPPDALSSVLNNFTYGTKKYDFLRKGIYRESNISSLTAIQIIECTMNAGTVKIYETVPNKEKDGTIRRIHLSETLHAQEIQRTIISEFEKWVLGNKQRANQLLECYKDILVGFSHTTYDGSFLKFPDLNPAISFYKHQKNAVARILLSEENVLLAHSVGAGKTYEIIAGVHELKRMGLSKKNLVVVPNGVLQATVDAHHLLYPNDKILAVFPKDFTPKYRDEILKRIQTEDFCAIYMAFSSFDMIEMSMQYWIDKFKAEIKTISLAIAKCTQRREKRVLEAEHNALERKLSKYVVEGKQTPWLTFDKLGITTLIVDEAHAYKNIPLNTRAENIVGMHTGGSKKCIEMLAKCHSVNRVIFATGTPLTNSLADLFVLQTYLQPEQLRFCGIDSFDMWLNCFGERETTYEIDVDSSRLRSMTRFSSFHNLTELMGLFSNVCDFHYSDDDNEVLPAYNGPEDIVVDINDAQVAYIKKLCERTEAIRNREVNRHEDNMLKITIDGIKCALDIRLIYPDSTITYGNSKVKACATKVYELYNKYPDTCQVVFSDLGTPKSEFNVYDALKTELVSKGIKESEIAFIHDAVSEKARSRMISHVNNGLIRVIIGSTPKLGIGVNMQERLIALHHLSVPWRPSDMTQREGRIIRRGNGCKEVFVYRYVTKLTFDGYSWQLLQNKQNFISSFLSGVCAERSSADIFDTVLSYAEIKALAIGDPLIRTRFETSNKLERARISFRQRQKQLVDLRAVVDNTPEILSQLGANFKTLMYDYAYYIKHKESIPNNERLAFGEELICALKDNTIQCEERYFDTYRGFEIFLPKGVEKDHPHVYVRRAGGGNYRVEIDLDKPMGCSKRIDILFENLNERADDVSKQMKSVEKHRREALSEIRKGNPYTKLIKSLTTKLTVIDSKLSQTEETA